MLKAEFKIDEPDQVLETPIYVRFVYTNRGRHPLSFSIGNGREDSYRFQAEPEAKELDPYYEFGGMAEVTEVPPREGGSKEILLNGYFQFLGPDSYVVKGELDLEVTEVGTDRVRPCKVRCEMVLNIREDERRRLEIVASLQQDLMGTDGAKQMRAANALAELRSPKALHVLQAGLDSSSPAVLEKMVIGLGNLGTEDAKKLLVEFMDRCPTPELNILAQQELSRFG